MRVEKYSFRFAGEVLNSKLSLKNEVENILTSLKPDFSKLSRPIFNDLLRTEFIEAGWEDQPLVFDEAGDPNAKMDFMKDRVGIEVGFGHPSFIGIDLLKFQICSYSGLDKIDVGIYIVTTKSFQKQMIKQHKQNWEGSYGLKK